MEQTQQLPATITMTPELMQLKITVALAKEKLNLPDLEKRALEMVKNEDHLKPMAELLADLDKLEETAETAFKEAKRPFLDGVQACDAGKKLVFSESERIRGMFKPDYDKLLAAVDARRKQQAQEKADEEAILQNIEANVLNFTNLIVAAINREGLLHVQRLINLEKTATREKTYGKFHQQAITRYDEVLIPVINDQKKKVDRLEQLNQQLAAAEVANDPEKMDEINVQIDELTNEILQNHARVQDAALKQPTLSTTVAEEVLPAFKVKRTDFTFEVADLDIALKKSRHLLEITVNNKACREVLKKLKQDKVFDDKDEVIVDGIKYIANKQREAL